MSDYFDEISSSQEEFPQAPTPNGSPKETNCFFQLMKGLCYFLLFIVSQVAATYILMIYYVFKLLAARGSNTEMNSSQMTDVAGQIVEEAYNKALANTNGLLCLYGFILVVFLLIFFALHKKNFFEETQFRKFSPRYLPAMVLLTLGFYFFIDAVLSLLPESLMESYTESSSFGSEGSFAVSMIAQALIAPLTEELTFRGLMLSRFDKALPKWIGIAISSLLFGWVHGNPIWFVYASAMGCIFCIAAEYTGSIFSTFLMHCTFNSAGTIFAYFFQKTSLKELQCFLIIGISMIIAGFYLFHCSHKAENALIAVKSQTDK